MRKTNIVFNVRKIVESELIATKEEIISYYPDSISKSVAVCIGFYDEEGSIIEGKNQNLVISGEKYEILMSESPSFAIGKPAGDFRRDDLWHIIDLIRNEQKIQ